MANVRLMKLMLKTLSPFKITSKTPGTVTMYEYGIQNTLSVGQVMRATNEVQEEDGTNRISCSCVTEQMPNEIRTESNDTRKIGLFTAKCIAHYAGTFNRMKYVICWYGHGPDKGTVGLPIHMTQHFIERYWSGLNRRTPKVAGTNVSVKFAHAMKHDWHTTPQHCNDRVQQKEKKQTNWFIRKTYLGDAYNRHNLRMTRWAQSGRTLRV